MEKYDDAMGERGAVENEKYCMPSWQKRNTEDMNRMMGYEDMSDLANTPKAPTRMEGAHRNTQEGPRLANPKHNDRSERAGM